MATCRTRPDVPGAMVQAVGRIRAQHGRSRRPAVRHDRTALRGVSRAQRRSDDSGCHGYRKRAVGGLRDGAPHRGGRQFRHAEDVSAADPGRIPARRTVASGNRRRTARRLARRTGARSHHRHTEPAHADRARRRQCIVRHSTAVIHAAGFVEGIPGTRRSSAKRKPAAASSGRAPNRPAWLQRSRATSRCPRCT